MFNEWIYKKSCQILLTNFLSSSLFQEPKIVNGNEAAEDSTNDEVQNNVTLFCPGL